MKQYTLYNNVYSVLPCTVKDIPSHIGRVLSYWEESNVNVAAQSEYLVKAVLANTAFKVVNQNNVELAVIYCNKLKRQVMQSNLLWLRSKIVFSILTYHFRMYEDIRVIQFLPHDKNFIPFEFAIKDSSIRTFHSRNTPLIADLYSAKSQLMYEKYFKDLNIKEVM